MDVIAIIWPLAAAGCVFALASAFLFMRLAKAQQGRYEAEKKLALAEHKLGVLEGRAGEFERMREESVRMAKAAILEAGGQMSSKLLADHKREAEAMKKESEERTKKVSEALTESMRTLAERVAALKDQHEGNDKRVINLLRVLSSPSGAGRIAEIGLENSLKTLGLEAGRDFVMQYAIKAGEFSARRPDCVIFLPQGMVMVIDSKSSRFLGDLAEAQSGQDESFILEKLQSTMREHLRDLASRDYRTAIEQEYARAGRGKEISMIWNIMYLPSEHILDRLHRDDPEFKARCEKERIILAGPHSLQGLLAIATHQVEIARQSENYAEIVRQLREVVDGFAMSLSHLGRLGNNLRTAASSFDAFARSANRFLLPKLAALAPLGIRASKGRELPARLASFDIRASDEPLTLEGEAGVTDIAEPDKLSA